MRGARGLRELLSASGIIVAPGAYDAVSAMLVDRAGFAAVYIGSYATAASRLGLPDAGLVSMREMVDHAAAVVGAVEGIPVIADAENGFGSAVTLTRSCSSPPTAPCRRPSRPSEPTATVAPSSPASPPRPSSTSSSDSGRSRPSQLATGSSRWLLAISSSLPLGDGA